MDPGTGSNTLMFISEYWEAISGIALIIANFVRMEVNFRRDVAGHAVSLDELKASHGKELDSLKAKYEELNKEIDGYSKDFVKVESRIRELSSEIEHSREYHGKSLETIEKTLGRLVERIDRQTN